MNEYEMLYIVNARKGVDDVPAIINWVNGLVTRGDGEVLTVDNWGRRRLAYPIDHEFEGTYVLTTMRLSADSTAALESALEISEDVVRHLLIRGIIPSDRRGQPASTSESEAPAQADAPAESEPPAESEASAESDAPSEDEAPAPSSVAESAAPAPVEDVATGDASGPAEETTAEETTQPSPAVAGAEQ